MNNKMAVSYDNFLDAVSDLEQTETEKTHSAKIQEDLELVFDKDAKEMWFSKMHTINGTPVPVTYGPKYTQITSDIYVQEYDDENKRLTVHADAGNKTLGALFKPAIPVQKNLFSVTFRELEDFYITLDGSFDDEFLEYFSANPLVLW